MPGAAMLVERVAELLPAQRVRLINPLVYSNMDLLADDLFRRRLHWNNAARDHAQPAVWLGRYDTGTYLCGDSPFPVMTRGIVVDEPTRSGAVDQPAVLDGFERRVESAVAFDQPCLLACRRGEWTWGHWLLDILPRIVLVESRLPRHFTFAVPGAITQPGAASGYAASVMGSLAAYGIDGSRLLRIHAGHVYRFDSLFDVMDIMCDGMHPGVLAAMQDSVQVSAGPRRRLTAVMRGRSNHRAIANADQIAAVLDLAGAERIDPAVASFEEQVRAFRDSETIVGDLGSNLAASIYAPSETGIVTLGPSGWHDFFFVQTFQRQRINHADVRGVAVSRTTQAIGHAPYLVDPAHLADGLDAACKRSDTGIPVAAGRLIARAPGLPLWEIRFGARGNAAAFQTAGFNAPEPDFTWSLGPSCTLEIPPFASPAGDCWLEIYGVGYTAAPYLVSRPIGVTVNDVLRRDFDMDDLTRLYVEVPKSVLLSRSGMKIIFHHQICPSPLSMGTGEDARLLGFRFEYVALRAS